MLDYVPPPRAASVRHSAWPFSGRTVLAPMEGVSHPELRNILAEKGGIGLSCTEFVRITDGPLNPVALGRAVDKSPGVALSVQVMGNHPGQMAAAARAIAEAGADVVDVNVGCPMPKIVKKGVGAALLEQPEQLFELLSRMREVVPGLLSAKIRAGFDTVDDALVIARTVEAAGADFIAVHPRRRADYYQGVADWRIIRSVKQELQIPVVGNGDVWYAADARRMRLETGCDAVMIGRPAVRNPWIFEQIAALESGATPRRPTGADLFHHYQAVVPRYQARFGALKKQGALGRLKELARFFGRAVPDDGAFVHAALHSASCPEIVEVARQHLASLPAAGLDLWAEGHLGLERSGTTVNAGAPQGHTP